MVQYFPVITGSLVVQGSVLITGSINTTAGITGSFSGTATTAQTASSVANLNQNVQITGSLTTSGTITAQTLNVQQVTSSIVFSSGSNVFGNSLSNRQQMTGSVLVTGSFGLNKAVPQRQYTQVANTNGIVFTIQNANASNEGYIIGFDSTGSTYAQLSNSANSPAVYLNSSGSSYFIGGNVGIGATSPTNRLEVIGVSGSSGIITPLYVQGWNATTNVGGTNTSYGGIQLTNAVDTTLAMRLLGSGHVQLSTDSSGRFISFGTDSFVERMRIASGGNVGIGTSSPTSLLTLAKDNAIGINTVDGSDNGYLALAGAGADGDNRGGHIYLSGNERGADAGTAIIAAGSVGSIQFRTGASVERMRISSTGVITEPAQPVAIGALVSDQSVSATTFTTLNYDTGTGYFARNIGSAWNNSTRTFTAPATGTYLVSVSLFTNNVGQVALFVNGGRTISIVSGTVISGNTTWNGECMAYLTAGDALTLRGYGDGGGTLFANGFHTWFQIRFLG